MAVAPADGKVVAIKPEGAGLTRFTIFLNVFDVHVNRTPIAGRIEKVEYQTGKFLVASKEACSTDNEQNVVTVQRRRHHRGLQADRRPDRAPHRFHQARWRPRRGRASASASSSSARAWTCLFGPEWEIVAKPGQRVAAGSSVIATRKDRRGA